MSYYQSSVLITGASQGIGRNIACAFASGTEHPLLLVARNRANLEETRQLCMRLGAKKAAVIVCDVTDEEQVASLRVPDGFPDPGIVVNNAGNFLYKKLAQTSNKEFNGQIQMNLFTAVNVVNRFLDTFKRADRAYIVNICSVSATRGLPDSGAYSAAKHALLGYTRSLRKEFIHTNIGVTAINLGQTHSPSWDESDIPAASLIDPGDIGKLIVTLSQMSVRTVVEEILIQPRHGRVPPM